NCGQQHLNPLRRFPKWKLGRASGWTLILGGCDRAQITFGRSRNRRFCIRENVRLPPAAINLLEWERFDSFNDGADRRRSERNEIWITSHKADVSPILRDGNDVAREQGAFATGTCRPMQHGAAFKMTSAIDQG